MRFWPFNERHLYHFCVSRQEVASQIEYLHGTFDCPFRIANNADYQRACKSISGKVGWEHKKMIVHSLEYLGRFSRGKSNEHL